jgi:hypothetical protein
MKDIRSQASKMLTIISMVPQQLHRVHLVFFLLLPATDLFAATIPASSLPVLPVTDGEDIRDIKDIIVQPQVNPLWYQLGGSVLLILLLVALFLYLKKRRTKIQIMGAHEKALQSLEAARSWMKPEHSKIFAVSLADILRHYLEDRFQLFMENLTTREFLQELMDHPETMPSELNSYDKMLGDWLTQCDLVKFAKYRLTKNEMEQMFNSISGFVTATRHEDNQS